MELHYKVLGQGAPIVILHGLFGMLDNWQSVAKVLADKYTIYLVDNRNHGRSPHDPEFNYEVMSADLHEFLQKHQIEQPVIIGHSMGGKIAMYFAGRYTPELFRKMVVVDIAPKYYRPHHRDELAGLFAVDLAHIGSRQEAEVSMARHITEPGTRQFLLKSLYRADDGKFAWRFNLPDISEGIENVGEGLPTHFYAEKPVLFIRGGQSRYIKDEDMELITTHFPNFRLETIPDAGHWVHAEKPHLLVEMIEQFIA